MESYKISKSWLATRLERHDAEWAGRSSSFVSS